MLQLSSYDLQIMGFELWNQSLILALGVEWLRHTSFGCISFLNCLHVTYRLQARDVELVTNDTYVK